MISQVPLFNFREKKELFVFAVQTKWGFARWQIDTSLQLEIQLSKQIKLIVLMESAAEYMRVYGTTPTDWFWFILEG